MMQLPLQITFRGMDPSPAVEAAIRERADKLERFFNRIVSCRVVVEAPHRHKHKGKTYSVRIDIAVPGAEVAVTHSGPKNQAHEDIYVAIRDAFDSARRRLEDHVREFRGDTKFHAASLHGKVVRLFPAKGYGFIEVPTIGEVYFHQNSVTAPGFANLKEGTEVRLVLAEGESAEGTQASTVTAVSKLHLADWPSTAGSRH